MDPVHAEVERELYPPLRPAGAVHRVANAETGGCLCFPPLKHVTSGAYPSGSSRSAPRGAAEEQQRAKQSVTQRFGNPTIGKQRKSKQFKSARVVKTLPRTGVLLPTFLTSARWRTAHPRFCEFCRVPSAPDDGTRPGLFAPLARVTLDQPARRLHHEPDRAAENLLHSRRSPLIAC